MSIRPNRTVSTSEEADSRSRNSKLDVIRLEDRLTPAGTITGAVFLDFNANGLLDSGATIPNLGSGSVATATDAGIAGVVVRAFDNNNVQQGVATTIADGTYTLNALGTGPYRIEFNGLPAGVFFGSQANGAPNVQSNTAVQFVNDGNTSNINLSLVRAEFITADNPLLITNCYVFGGVDGVSAGPGPDQTLANNEAVIVSFPYNSGANDTETNIPPYANPPTHAIAVTQAEVGTTWGLTYDKVSNRLYAAAFTKRHSGYGPDGPGAIYYIEMPSTTNPTITTADLFIDLGAAAGGVNFRTPVGGVYDYALDSGNTGWDAVGKTGLGGLDVDPQGQFMYTIGLADRLLYRIAIPAAGALPTAGDVTTFNLPVPASVTGGPGLGDLRPFAVQYYNGIVYVGAVNSAESTGSSADLRAYVFAFNPATGQFVNLAGAVTTTEAVLDIALNYDRGIVHPGDTGGGANGSPAEWLAWSPTFNTVSNAGERYAIYPQPWLTGLAFDVDGNLVLGLRDRTGDQAGNLANDDNPLEPGLLTKAISAGDTLRAFINTAGNLGSGWTLENNGNGTAGAGNNQGPGGGEFYFQEELPPGLYPGVIDDHQEVSLGGVLQLPGRPDLLTTVFDPIRISGEYDAGGVRYFDNTTGELTQAYRLYDVNATLAFAKANGLGDLVAASPQPGIEIGNRIWDDANGNGLQDPGEAGIQNVEVVLCLDGNPFATATTDANGDYYFSSNAGTSTANRLFGVNFSNPGAYTLCIPVSQTALTGFGLTTANANANANDNIDSDATLIGGNAVVPITLPSAGTADHTLDVGFRAAAQLSGFVYADTNNDGVRDGGEAAIPNTIVVLTGTVNGNPITAVTATTNGSGFYEFTGLAAGVYTVTETQPAGFLDGIDTPGTPGGGSAAVNDVISGITLNAGDNSQNNNFGELAPASITGFVYEDCNDNGIFEPTGGDAAIPNAIVVLTGTVGGNPITPITATTDGNGFYQFLNLAPGTYTVNETQPAGFFDGQDTAGAPGAGTAGNDVISGIVLTAGLNSQNNNFGEIPPSTIAGVVYEDLNNNGVQDGGENGISNVIVVLSGTVGGNPITPLTATTIANGQYTFGNLQSGNYTLTQTQPTTGYIDGQETAGTAGGNTGVNDVISAISLGICDDATGYLFGEIPVSQISGFVYADTSNDGIRDGGEAAISNTIVVLTGTVGGNPITPLTATTDGAGFYQFLNLAPGTYTVTETQPAGFLDGLDTPGTPGGGTAGNDVISNITITPGLASPNNNFGELPPAQLSGYVYFDADNSDTPNTGDSGISGVQVVLTGTVGGNPITPLTATTDGNGFYQFLNLLPGSYTVTETQPAGFVDGAENVGSTGGTSTTNDVIENIPLLAGQVSELNNFGERRLIQPTISGNVFFDADNSGTPTIGDSSIPGALVILTGDVNGNPITPLTATTNSNGFYEFGNLQPGTYKLTEIQPAGFNDGVDTAGTAGGDASVNDMISNIVLAPNTNSLNNNFAELAPITSTLSGYVYFDANNDGNPDAGDSSIPGAIVVLTGDVNGSPITPQTATTNASGFYEFANLAPGTYKVTETQPTQFADGIDRAGSTGGDASVNDMISAIPLAAGQNSLNNNFGERPLPEQARLSGFVYRDTNVIDGIRDVANGETGIGGVVIELYRVNIATPTPAELLATTTTNASGFYEFINLEPGNYLVREFQPVNFFDGLDTPGSTGGQIVASLPDMISTIPLAAGQNSVNNNFGEIPCVSLFGFVWEDLNRNGSFDPGEPGIPGATVTVSGTAFAGTPLEAVLTSQLAGGPLTITTDANGRWEFFCLPPGNYTLNQSNTPPGLQDFQSQNQSSGFPIQISTASSFANIGVQQSAAGPLNFGKVADGTAAITDPTKLNFLGSSALGGTTTPSNPLVTAPTEVVPLNPQFAVTTGGNTPTYVVGSAGAGFSPVVRVFDYASGLEQFRFFAFEQTFTGGVTTATGDVNNDGVDDIITAAGQGGGPRVRVFDGRTGTAIQDFFAFSPEFRGGLYVASGDFNNDGFSDIVVGAGEGGGPHVRIFSGRSNELLLNTFAFDPAQTGGARVAVGDFNGDGQVDLAAANGPGAAPLIRTFNGNGFSQISQFSPYAGNFTGGVFLTAGDFNGDGIAEIATGAGAGGGPHVQVFSTAGQRLASFFAYESTFSGGVRVSMKDITGDGRADIITGAGIGGASRIRAFSGANLLPVEDFFLFDSGVRTGAFVG